MNNRKVIFWALFALAVAALAFFLWSNYQIVIQERPDKPIKLPWQISEKCGIENCHGMDITCGANIPEACTMIYMAGDNCRQFAVCVSIDGQCKQEPSQKFDTCKACVEKCEIDHAGDSMAFFECESMCAE